ncbi:hypothetical protein PRIPAC_85634 [Pristionchus pacificus]|uniref:Uncharacterized protein n=1 Tax=Pristionchus pacificus TaxID=54126 RepID=A0A2A6BLN4_PRIPA|nr:hypothetical protein PRIPAC_85634 [Pristionchus pacificus]|eukprot:PDM66830.1 hypothetical protein PRIPAC_48247 [Pristionchus pacificus]
MRKLASRCRRVRPGRKTREIKEDTDDATTAPLDNQQTQQHALGLLASGFSPDQWLEHVKVVLAHTSSFSSDPSPQSLSESHFH